MSFRLAEDNVIDNRKVILKDELEKILPKSSKASIAVGYFFISGIAPIIKPLKEIKKIRLLISNTTDKSTADTLIEGFKSIKEIHTEIEKKNFVNDLKRSQVLSDSKLHVKKSLEFMNQTLEDKDVVTTLIEMMKNKQLEVRVYPKEKLHAKAYIFELKDSDLGGIGIVGSSNLSLSGILQNSELNLKTKHNPDINKLLEWFDELWKDGLEFTEDFNIILADSWAGRAYSPYEMYLKAAYHEVREKLEGQHSIDPIFGSTFPKLFDFQKTAVDYGLTMFELYGGVIIGDVVGLGKTYIGTALLKYLQMQGYRPLIVCPPHLMSMWEKFTEDYEVDAKILSRGLLSQGDFELFQQFRYKDRDLVLIDESHHFRNKGTRQYENLHQFMQARDAKAILLTATPYANKPEDIKNQIMLFHSSPETSIPPANETDLDRYFRLINNGKADLVDLLRNIMIRRTRRYILNQWGKTDESDPERKYLVVGKDRMYFPKRSMKTTTYNIDTVYQRKYASIVGRLDQEHLTLARYSPGLYMKKEFQEKEPYNDLKTTGPKLVALMRHLLLKRMESSLKAFQDSVEVYINTHRIFLRWLDQGIIPIGETFAKEMYEIAREDPDLIDDPQETEKIGARILEEIKRSNETKYDIKAFEIDKLRDDIEKDLETFEEIRGLIQRITYKTDDKLISLQKLLENEYSGKKVLIFTEFATTAKYLFDVFNRTLKWKGNKEQVDASTGNAIQIARKFDQEHNPGYDEIQKSDEVNLLISTDILSEGVNLQAGQVIINYDFHWNPIRLIQRAGRVDRIGSKNEVIEVINFLPDPKIEQDLGLEAAVSQKIDEIQRVIGEDYKILKEDEIINDQDTYAIYYNMDESILDREDGNSLEPSEFERILTDIQVNDPKFWEEFKEIPDGIRSSDAKHDKGKLLITCESMSESGRIRKYYLIGTDKKTKEITSRDAMSLLKSEDKQVHPLQNEYDVLVSIGWKKFLTDLEQIRAKEVSGPALTITQKWIIKRLMDIAKQKEFFEEKDKIETLRKVFSKPITMSAVNRELNKIKKGNLDDARFFKILTEIYKNFELQKKSDEIESEYSSP